MSRATSMGNKEFLGYVLIHSKTERAQFSVGHYKRLMKLAGIHVGPEVRPGYSLDPNGVITIRHDVAKDLVAVARGEKTLEDIARPAPKPEGDEK